MNMSFIVVVMGEDNRVKSQLQRSDLPFDSPAACGRQRAFEHALRRPEAPMR